MRIAEIVPSLQEQHGGPSKSVSALAAALARGGHAVNLLTTHPRPEITNSRHETEGTLRTQIYPRVWPQRICRSPELCRALSTLDFEIIHHHSLWLRTVHYAHRQAKKQGIPFVISPRGMMSTWAWNHHAWRKRLARWLVHPNALAAVDGWHATSEEERREIRALGFDQPICVAPNGVEAFSPAECDAAVAYWREICPETTQRQTALFYGRFHEKKRVLELIDIWLEVAPPDWLLLLVGIPEDYTPAQLEAYVQKMSAAGRIRAFSGGGRPKPYAIASLFLQPSHNENFGLTIAEAMASSVPALVTDTTPWGQINTDGRGWCVSWQDYRAALKAATMEPAANLKQRGERARLWVLREFSWGRAAEKLQQFYSAVSRGIAAADSNVGP